MNCHSVSSENADAGIKQKVDSAQHGPGGVSEENNAQVVNKRDFKNFLVLALPVVWRRRPEGAPTAPDPNGDARIAENSNKLS